VSPRIVVLTFFAAVAAVVAGYIGGGLLHDAVGSGHDVAIGVVDAQAGAPVATASPTAAPATSAPVESVTPSPELLPSASPSPEASYGPCPGTPPRDGCECRERKKNSRWVCPLF
jgi:hypothetical protein